MFFLKSPLNFKQQKIKKQLKLRLKHRKYCFYPTEDQNTSFTFRSKITPFLKSLRIYFLFYSFYNKTNQFFGRYIARVVLIRFLPIILSVFRNLLRAYRTVFKQGFFYIRTLCLVFFLDASFTDDEPLWEPIEWSLVMTWILFIFVFAWIAENLITSRYGSFTGRDKRVWFGWFKTYWLLESWFAISYGTAAMFVILPFYTELVYSLSFTFSWWHWYTRVFFYKFVSLYSIMLLLATYVQINLRWLNWKKLMCFCILINCILSYMLYTHVVMTFFAYFTDPLWYQKTKVVDYIQMSHEPWKWGWGAAKRDHFSYHKVSTVFWFKNDGPYAGAFLLIQSFFFISLFLLYIYWLTLLRRVYSTKELTITFYVYCVSALRQFFFCFSLFYVCIFISFLTNYWRFPLEFMWLNNTTVWGAHFFIVLLDYWTLIYSFFKL